MEAVLQNFLSPDNGVRKAAEGQIDAFRKADRDGLVAQLVQVMRTSQAPENRLAATVVLRKILMAGEQPVWPLLAPPAKEALKAELLAALQAEGNKKTRENVGTIVAEIATDSDGADATSKAYGSPALWPALWSTIQQAVTSPSHDLQETGLVLIEQLADLINIELEGQLEMFKQLFLARMGDASLPMNVRLAAARAAGSLLLFIRTTEVRKPFSAVLPPMLATLQAAVAAGDSDTAEMMSGHLSQLAEDEDVAPLFKPFVKEAVALLAGVAGDARQPTPVRINCMLVLVGLAEAAPAIVRKAGASFLPSVLPVIFNMATEFGDQDDDWLAKWEEGDEETDIDEEEAEGCLVTFALEQMARLGDALTAGFLRDGFLSCVQQLVVGAGQVPPAAAWPKKHAAYLAFAQVAGVVDDDKEQQRIAVQQLAGALRTDPSSRVRWAAVYAMCALLDESALDFKQNTHDLAVPALMVALADSSKRVRHQACVSIIAYSMGLDSLDVHQCLTPYSDDLVQALTAVFMKVGAGMSRADSVLREASITAIAAVGSQIGAKAGKYYGGMRDGLLHILQQPEPPQPTSTGSTPEERKLRQEQERALMHARKMKGKALECLSVLGVAAGKAVFEADAQACLGGVVGMLQSIQAEKKAVAEAAAAAAAAAAGGAPAPALRLTASDNPVQSFIWDTIGRLSGVLQPEHMAPALAHVMPALLEAANAKTSEVVSQADLDDSDDEDEDEGGGAEMHEKGNGEVIRVRTADLEDKTAALTALGSMFTEMNQAQWRAGGGGMTGPSMLFSTAPAVLAVCRKVITEGGSPMDTIRHVACDAVDEALVALASGITAAQAVAAALDVAAANGVLPQNMEQSPPHVYVAGLLGLLNDLSQAFLEEDSADMKLRLTKAFKLVLSKGCVRSIFHGERPSHELPDNARYLPLLPAAVTEKLYKTLVQDLRHNVQRRVVRSQEVKLKKAEGDLDEEAEAMMEGRDEDDNAMISTVTESMGTLLKITGMPQGVVAQVLPAAAASAGALTSWPSFAQHVLPDFQVWMQPGTAPRDVAVVVSLAVDVLEFVGDAVLAAGPENAGPLGELFRFVLGGMQPAQDGMAKQAAAYGVGAVSARLTSMWPDFLNPAMAALSSVLREKDTDGSLRDTAVASMLMLLNRTYPAVAAAASSRPGFVPRGAAMAQLLPLLPLMDDDVEAKNATELLVGMLQARDPDAFGPAGGAWGPEHQAALRGTLAQFAVVLDRLDPEDLALPRTPDAFMHRAILGCLHWLQVSGVVPPAVIAGAVASLPKEQQDELQAHMALAAAAASASAGAGGAATPTSPGRH